MSESEIATDRAGRIETHGADYIPEAERHGSPRSLFPVWAGSNVIYLYFVLGGLMVILGLNVWQAIAVVLAGNLLWAVVGYLAISGPSSGSPSEVILRAFFGVNGNRVYEIAIGWVIGVLYEAINLAVGALAGVALVTQFFGSAPDLIKAAIIVGLAVVTFTISVLGHATIVKLGPWFTWVLLAALVILGYFVISHADMNYQPQGGALSGSALWAAAATCFALIASSPLSWSIGADYSRYLPSRTSAKATAFWTGFGGFVPATGITILGVLAATAVDMTNPQEAMAKIMPAWFYVIFLLIIIIGSIFNNALTAYSTGLALLATGIPWRRSITVIFDAAVSIAVTLYALFVSNFLDTLSGLLEVSVAVLAPSMAIYAVDIFLRRNRYDGPALQDTSRSSSYWFFGGFNLGGCAALVIGTAAATLCLNTTFYVGPVAQAVGGADISFFVGSLVGGGLYAATEARRIRAASQLPVQVRPHDPASQEGGIRA